MYIPKMDEDMDCDIRLAFKVFGGKWKLCIIDALSRGITRPTAIRKEIKVASMRVIKMQLGELLHYGAVEKCAEIAYPKRSEYQLTHLGQSILPLLNQIDRCGTANAEVVQAKYYEKVMLEL